MAELKPSEDKYADFGKNRVLVSFWELLDSISTSSSLEQNLFAELLSRFPVHTEELILEDRSLEPKLDSLFIEFLWLLVDLMLRSSASEESTSVEEEWWFEDVDSSWVASCWLKTKFAILQNTDWLEELIDAGEVDWENPKLFGKFILWRNVRRFVLL